MSSFPQDGTTPLYMAAQNNNVQVVEVLLSAGANANLADEVRFVSCCQMSISSTSFCKRLIMCM